MPALDFGPFEQGGADIVVEDDDPMGHRSQFAQSYELPVVSPLYRVPRFLRPGMPPVPIFSEHLAQDRVLAHLCWLTGLLSVASDKWPPMGDVVRQMKEYSDSVSKFDLQNIWRNIAAGTGTLTNRSVN